MPSIKVYSIDFPSEDRHLFVKAAEAREEYEKAVFAMLGAFWKGPVGTAMARMHVGKPRGQSLESIVEKFKGAGKDADFSYFVLKSASLPAASPFYAPFSSLGAGMHPTTVNQLLNSKTLTEGEKRKLAHKVTGGVVGDAPATEKD